MIDFHCREQTARCWRRGVSSVLLAMACSAPLVQGAEPKPDQLPGWRLSAPNASYRGDGVAELRHGFVLTTSEGWTLIGNGLRWAMRTGDAFAMGDVVLAIPGGTSAVTGAPLPGLRIEATRLGLHRPPAGSGGMITRGEAWDVKVFVAMGQRTLRLACDHLIIDRDQIILRTIHGDGGHGGVLAINAARLVIDLRDQVATDRQGFERVVGDVTFWHPRVSLAGVPVAYAPVLYRDYRLDYPWTRYEFGDSSRQGQWVRGWIGTDLPSIAGWQPRLIGRGDYYRDVGSAYGTRARWWHREYGRGEFLFYEMSDERIKRDDSGQRIGLRNAHVVDAEQRLSWSGGAFYGRWTDTPSADPGYPFDERFRTDYLTPDVEERPLARRGAAIAQTTPWASFVLRNDYRTQRNPNGSDITFSSEALVPGIHLVGPLSIEADARAERLEREQRNDQSDRLAWRITSHIDHWFDNGLGLHARAGIEGLAYADSKRAGAAIDDAQRSVPTAAVDVRYQLIGRFANGLTHRFTPHIGLRARWPGRGDELADFAFDLADDFEEDVRELTLGFDTDVSNRRTLMRLRTDTRWALRDEDLPRGRDQADSVGQRLRSASIEASAHPNAILDLSARGEWNGDRRDWESFDGDIEWVAHYNLQLALTATYTEIDNLDSKWQYRPRVTIIGNRYRMVGALVFDDDQVDEARSLAVDLQREMVDGVLSIGYQLEREDDGDKLEHSITIGFEIDTFSIQ